MNYQQCTIILAVLLALSQACHAQLKCYACENCDKVTLLTPLITCDASYFVADTAPSTTIMPTTMMPVEDTTTTVMAETMPTTISSTSDSTMTTVMTEAQPPTPATVTTTPLPTPPTEGTLPTNAFAVADGNSTAAPLFMLASRRRRAIVADDDAYTYHCYRIQNEVNGVNVTSRGCSRVTTMESVCGTLQQADNITSQCYPCSMNRCNGSSALSVSAIALIMAIIASVLHSQ